MQDIRKGFGIKRLAKQSFNMLIAMSKPHVHCKLKICNRYTDTIKKRNPYTTVKSVIKSYTHTKKTEQKRKRRQKTFFLKSQNFF